MRTPGAIVGYRQLQFVLWLTETSVGSPRPHTRLAMCGFIYWQTTLTDSKQTPALRLVASVVHLLLHNVLYTIVSRRSSQLFKLALHYSLSLTAALRMSIN